MKSQQVEFPPSADRQPGEQRYRVCENERYGFIDASGKVVIPPSFNYAWNFSDGLARVKIENESGNKSEGFIDATGRFAIGPGPPPNYRIRAGYESIWQYTDFSEGYAGFWAGDSSGRSGYIDKRGRVVIPVEFESIGDFSEGLACVSVQRKNGLQVGGTRTGFIDHAGKFVIAPERSFIGGSFVNGLCYVNVSKPGGRVKWGYIDRHGKFIVPFIYDGASEFSEGLASVRVTTGTIGNLGEIRGQDSFIWDGDGLSWSDATRKTSMPGGNGVSLLESVRGEDDAV